MKEKTGHVITIVAFAILANVFGKVLADQFQWPLWLDSFGTAFCAYLLGPFPGAVVGASGNIMYSLFMHSSEVYAIVNALIGITVGIMAKKGKLQTFFGAMSVCSLVTVITVAISVPLNVLLYGGATGNLWGDSVIEYMQERHIPTWLTYVIGEFYLDFLDKVITLLTLFVCVRARKSVINAGEEKKEEKAHVKHMTAGILALCLLATACFPAIPARAAEEVEIPDFYSYVQTLYNGENGLPCGKSNDVAETNDGILWIGTYAGLYRYNGREFKLMTDYDSVKNVNCLYTDGEGRLWIGTNDNGLSIAISEEIGNVLDMSNGLPSNSVRSIEQSANGDYYVGTSDALVIIRLDGGLFIADIIPEIMYAHSLAADANGYVAAVTNMGNLYVMKDGEIVMRQIPNTGEDIFTCCEFDSEGILHVGTSGSRVDAFDISGDKLKKISSVECPGIKLINSVNYTEDGIMYVCSDSGVCCVTPKGKTEKIHMMSFENSVDNMLVDYQGNYWFTSSRLGLLRLSKSAFLDLYGSANMQKTLVNSVIRWQGLLYVGTDVGLSIIDEKTEESVRNNLTEELDGVRIRCFTVDSNENLWISTYGNGLYMVGKNGKLTLYNQADTGFSDWVRCTIELQDGTIVSAGDTGVAYFRDGNMVKLIPYGEDFCSAMVLCLAETEPGTVLCGSDGDGLVVVKNGEVESTIGEESGLHSGVVMRVVKSSDNPGYYIVASNGLYYMDVNYKVTELNDFPYFNNFDVYTAGNGKIFILSSAGIYVAKESDLLQGDASLDIEMDEQGNMVSISVTDGSYESTNSDDLKTELLDYTRGLSAGITANSWNYLDKNGRLYVSTDTGVYCLDTRNYSSTQKSYRMSVRRARVDSEDVRVERGSEVILDRDTKKFEIFPEIINYTVENPLVSYQMIGFDDAPIYKYADELDSVVYTNLPSGEYTFELQVLDENFDSLERSSYRIVKEMDLQDHWWFRAYLLLVAAVAVAWLTWFVARTQIQTTLNYQKREIEFVKKQVQMGNETILAIAKTVDAKDENTSQHSQRVSEYSVLLARELGFTEDECENLRKAALLHDLGKIGIPDKILNKPAKLTDEEYAVMKTHVTRGAEILKDFTIIDHVVEGALYHHERYDGNGYANGLKGEEIPIYGRIIGVADAFDAMTQNRVYRKKLDMDYVISELERCKGTQFDPEIAEIMLRLVAEGKVDPVLKPQWEEKEKQEKEQQEKEQKEDKA